MYLELSDSQTIFAVVLLALLATGTLLTLISKQEARIHERALARRKQFEDRLRD